jgi:hypothetical protein
MNDPHLPPVPEHLTKPVVAWLERQVAKLLAMAAALIGGALDAGDGRTFAWFVALLVWIMEVYQSRRAERARLAQLAAAARTTPPQP